MSQHVSVSAHASVVPHAHAAAPSPVATEPVTDRWVTAGGTFFTRTVGSLDHEPVSSSVTVTFRV